MANSDNYSIKNPLKRDGTSQGQRQPVALDPEYVKVDERTIQDFMVFARNFAKQVYYYNQNNKIEGDWEDFWTYDISFIIAAIQKTNPQDDKQRFFQVQESKPRVEGLAKLIREILNVAGKLDTWMRNLVPATDFSDQISRLIRANLNVFLGQIAAYDKGAYEVLGSKNYPRPDEDNYTTFSSIWKLGDFNKIEADTNLFRQTWEPAFSDEPPPNPDENEKIEIAYENLKTSFNEVFNVYFQAIRQAASWFDKSLLVNDHEPHIALFIAFLRLYQAVQADINKITEKHLDFYFRDVLQLKLKPATPDHSHLYFALAKHINEHELSEGTRFLAGKDQSGADLFYSLDKDIVLNKAQIDSLQTVFIKRKEDAVQNIFAAPVANSSDGKGAEFSNEDEASWMTFGSNKMPEAEVGFAIASNEFLLAEGKRVITLTINYSGPDLTEYLNGFFDIWFSGEEELFQPIKPPVVQHCDSHNCFDLVITLGPEEPAIIPFDEQILKSKLGTQLPVMKVLLRPPVNDADFKLDIIKDIKITSLSLDIDVSGVNSLLAFNDLGAVDPSKPFLPYGPAPVVGSSFFIGSKEAFQKNLTKITLNLTWENLPKVGSTLNFEKHYDGYDDPPANKSSYTFKTTILKSTGASQLTDPKQFFETQAMDNNGPIPDQYIIEFENSALAYLIQANELEKYGQKPDFGFLRLDLQRDFEHDQYSQVLTRQTIAMAKFADTPPKMVVGAYYWKSENGALKPQKATSGTLYPEVESVIQPNEPYTPTVKTISLDYASSVDLGAIALTNTKFIHLHPFVNTYQQFETVENLSLIPQLHKNTSSIPHINLEGSLLLGLKDLKSKQSLSILFQVAGNTADADVDEAIVQWQYLSDNKWVDFKSYEITSDTTKGLVASGIITFTIPEANTTGNTILPNHRFWLRAWVEKDSGAVSEIINIHTQAARITFQNNNNDPDHLDTPLPEKTISKLENDDSAIDSIHQDYASFGGRPAEKALKFYTRVSERLRHKGRAITLYDYERIILEQFPDIYKVKCISHTNENDQTAPGHVLLAVIPDFTKMTAMDRGQPKVTRGRLDEIRKYLEPKNPTFVGTFANTGEPKKYLHVSNPKYEKVRVNFSVRFKPEVTAIDFHIRKLRKAIIRFLSPWAYEDAAEINFGGKVFKSSILDFVEAQEYIDYVINFMMMREGSNADVNSIETDSARTILVPDQEDRIEIFSINEADHCPTENLISGDTLGYMTINDFEIRNEN